MPLKTNRRHKPAAANARSERLARLMVAIVTCLGALGLAALLYFPLHYLQ